MKRFSAQYYQDMRRHIDSMPPQIRKVFNQVVKDCAPLTDIDVMGLYSCLAPENLDRESPYGPGPSQLLRLVRVVQEILQAHRTSVN